MKSRVEIYKTSFFVNEEKKIVTCIITADFNINKLEHPPLTYLTPKVFVENGIGNSSAIVEVGIAKCNPLDVFDIDKGKRIAESRAKQQIFKKANRFYTSVSVEIESKISYFDELAETCLRISQNEIDYLENKLMEG